jgi:hypothetical protein
MPLWGGGEIAVYCENNVKYTNSVGRMRSFSMLKHVVRKWPLGFKFKGISEEPSNHFNATNFLEKK